MKKFIYFGLFVGSTIGGFIPAMWGTDMLSPSGFLWSTIGGIFGIWLGYRFSRHME